MGHWYTMDGKPMHTVIGKNGKERDTTLADARKYQLLPSSTTILSEWANQDLERASRRRLLEQAYLTKIEGLDQREWAKKVTDEAFKEWTEKADFGTKIHAAIEAKLRGDAFDFTEEVVTPEGDKVAISKFVNPVMAELKSMGLDKWEIVGIEKTMAYPRLGYAGTVDLAYIEDGKGVVIDFKTTTTRKDEPVLFKKNHLPQIASYWHSIFNADEEMRKRITKGGAGHNIYISTTEVGRIDVRSYSSADIIRGTCVFDACVTLWQDNNEYYPNLVMKIAENEQNTDTTEQLPATL